MAVKMIVDTLEGLDEPIAQLYSKGEDGKYRLGVEGIEDTTGLKKKLDAVLAEKKAQQERAEEAQKRLEELTEAKQRKDGDVESIDKSHKERYAKLKKEMEDAIAVREKELDALIRKTQVSALLDGNVDPTAKRWIERDILERTRLESVDGKRLVRVLDEEGNPTAQSLDEFIKSNVLDNKDYAKYVIGSRGAGGGANGTPSGGGANGKTLSEMSGLERVQLARNNPDLYKQMRG